MDIKKEMPPAMILCGGQGTRLREVTELLPKPMVPIGEQPILWHIMKLYAAFGVRRFILCLGYKKEAFIDYFLNYHLRTSDATITLGHDPRIEFHSEAVESDWRVTLAATGIQTMTGGRVRAAAKYLQEEDTHFFLTYGDGLSDVDLASLYRFHLAKGKLLTLSAVHPAGRYGEMGISGDGSILSFDEKSVSPGKYINGGFMVVKRDFVGKYLSAEDCFLEQKPLSSALADGELAAFRHEGFWQCMDTPREHQYLNDLWNAGRAPWRKYW